MGRKDSILGAARLEIVQWCEVLTSADVLLATASVGLYIENKRGVFFDNFLKLVIDQ